MSLIYPMNLSTFIVSGRIIGTWLDLSKNSIMSGKLMNDGIDMPCSLSREPDEPMQEMSLMIAGLRWSNISLNRSIVLSCRARCVLI